MLFIFFGFVFWLPPEGCDEECTECTPAEYARLRPPVFGTRSPVPARALPSWCSQWPLLLLLLRTIAVFSAFFFRRRKTFFFLEAVVTAVWAPATSIADGGRCRPHRCSCRSHKSPSRGTASTVAALGIDAMCAYKSREVKGSKVTSKKSINSK